MRLIEQIRSDKRFLKRLFIISCILSVILILLICLPLFIPHLAKPFHDISAVLISVFNTVLAFSTVVIEIIALTGQAYKKEKIKRAVLVLLIVILPFILVQISEPILKMQIEYSESADLASSVTDDLQNEDYKKITVNYHAPLFNHDSSEEICLHQSDYETAILETICTKDEYINYNSDFAEYEKNTLSAQEYEEVYIGILRQNSFETLRDERIRMIDLITTYRIQADVYYQYSENQRLIGIGYQNKASELYCIGETDSAVKQYEMSITWFLSAMTTAYNEQDADAAIFDQLLGDIIDSYQQISNITNEYTIEHKNAEVLIAIYQSYTGSQFLSENK